MICCVDWLTFSKKCEEVTWIEAIKETENFLPGVEFGELGWKESNGRYMFDNKLSYEGCEILYNGNPKAGIQDLLCFNLTGKGCRTYETYNKGDIMSLLKKASVEGYKVSRLDLAVDDREGVLDIDQMYKLSAMRYDKQGHLSDNCYWWGKTKVNSRQQGSDGCTMYFGSPTSDIRIRIYDKAAEQGIDGHWVRVEVVLRKEKAQVALEQIIADNQPGKIFASILRQQLFFSQSLLQNLTSRTLTGIVKPIFATGGTIFLNTPHRLL